MSAPSPEPLEAQNHRLRLQAEALQRKADALQAQTDALRTQIQELEAIRRDLEHLVGIYKRHLFGSRSEKIDAQELEARIAQAAAEAREQMAQEKRPGDPPPQAEEEAPEEGTAGQPADVAVGLGSDEKKDQKRKAHPHGRGNFPAHLPRRRIEHPVDPAQAVCACSAAPPSERQARQNPTETQRMVLSI